MYETVRKKKTSSFVFLTREGNIFAYYSSPQLEL